MTQKMSLPSWKRGMRIRLLDQAKADLVDINEHYREIGGAKLASTMLA